MSKMKLEDETLSGVNGGVVIKAQVNSSTDANSGNTTVERDCPVCNKKMVFNVYTGGRAVCTKCGYKVNDA